MENQSETTTPPATAVSEIPEQWKLLEEQVEEVEKLAGEHEQESQKMVRRSIGFDALTVIFGAASPALTVLGLKRTSPLATPVNESMT